MKKNDQPFIPFYTGDWFKAMDIQSLPREVRCVWIEMIFRMWESNERGYLTMKGKPMSDFAKANALGFGSAVDDYLKIEKVLEESGIFSRRQEDGAIYCRKILHLLELKEKRSKSGSEGGKATWSKFAKANAKATALAESDNETDTENVTEPAKVGRGEKPAPAPRPYFDAVVNTFDFKALIATKKGGAQVGALANDFKKMCEAEGKDHTEISAMAERYKAANPGKPLNPYFIKTAWSQLKNLGSNGKPVVEYKEGSFEWENARRAKIKQQEATV